MRTLLLILLLKIVNGENNLYYLDFKNLLYRYNISVEEQNYEEYYENYLTNYFNIDDYMKNTNSEIQYELNEFALMNTKEFEFFYLGKYINKQRRKLRGHHKIYHNSNNENLHQKVDWRLQSHMSNVMKQDKNSFSWAYGVVDVIQSIYSILNDDFHYLDLSIQELIDCNYYEDEDLPQYIYDSYDYIINNGLSLEYNYPFEGYASECKKHHEPYYYIGDYHIIPENNERELMYVLSNHPVLVNIDVSMPFFRFYKSGVLRYQHFKDCGSKLNHSVLLVGYGEENGVKYWILKNSWGIEWGEKGYFRLERGVNIENGGVCGILKSASYPIF